MLLVVFAISCFTVGASAEYSLFEMIQLGSSQAAPAMQNIFETMQEQVGSDDEQPSKASEMTVMIYLCGSSLENNSSNPEEVSASASLDVIEMAYSEFNPEKVNLLVLAGGSKDWTIDNICDGATSLYRLHDKSIYTLFSDGKAYNMGAPEMLTAFLRYGYEYFPAEKFALIMWDHGGGSLSGLCHDINFDDSLDMMELSKGIGDSPFGGEKLDWIGFDACLMAAAEVANLMAPYADYMIASEETEPGFGWNYNFLKGIENDETPAVTGERIINTYFEFAEDLGYEGGNLTLSCIDLSKIDAVAKAAEAFYGTLKVDKSTFAEMSRKRRETMAFGRDESDSFSDFDLVDLGDFTKKLSQIGGADEAKKLLDAIDDCVKHTKSTMEDCTGLSVYHPFYNKALYPIYGSQYGKISLTDGYDSFVRAFGNYLVSNGKGIWSGMETDQAEAEKDTRTVFNLLLTEEQMAEFGEAVMVCLQRIGDTDAWRLVATQGAHIGENGMLVGNYVHTNLFVLDANGQPIHDVPIVYFERDNGLYIVPAILVKGEKRTGAQIILSRDSITDLMTVVDVYLYDEAIDGYTPRLTASLEDYDSVIYQSYERVMTQNEQGALVAFENWETANVSEYAWNTQDAWQLAFVEDHLDVESLYVSFAITDIFNNVYMSNPAPIAKDRGDSLGYTVTYDDDFVLVENFALTEGGNGKIRLSATLTSNYEAEAILIIDNVLVNGQTVNAGAEVYGNGENDGLLSGESQILLMSVPAESLNNVESIDFEILFTDAEGEVILTVPVNVIVSMAK